MGRLDHLVEAVYERFKDRYFTGERAFLVTACLTLLALHFSFCFSGVLVDLSGVK